MATTEASGSVSYRQVLLKKYPEGVPKPEEDFEVATATLDVNELGDGDVLLRVLYLSVDPYMRILMRGGENLGYMPPFPLDQAPTASLVARVVESRRSDVKTGDLVVTLGPWAEYFVHHKDDQSPLNRLEPTPETPLSYFLGVLGMPGLSAYLGLWKNAELKPGQTLFVSGAAGAVGHIVGQLGKNAGARVVGSAGSAAKVKWLSEELGFDEVINYKEEGDMGAALKRACPEGIDVYFDNVGGTTLEAALDNMKQGGVIVACGSISVYNSNDSVGIRNFFNVVSKCLTVKGFLLTMYSDSFLEGQQALTKLFLEKKLKCGEHVVEGVENIPKAFVGLLTGENIGKMVVKLADE